MPSGAPFGNDEKLVVPRISDVYAALPAITGKLELEYEGEMKGADFVGRELIRTAIAKTYDRILHRRQRAANRAMVRSGRRNPTVRFHSGPRSVAEFERDSRIDGETWPLNVSQKDSPEQQVSAAEFILEGLHAHKRIGRNEERVFKAGEKSEAPRTVRARKGISNEKNAYRQKKAV